MLLGVLGSFLFEQVQVRQCYGDLRLDLHELVFHVEDHLLQHLLGILGLVEQVVEVCAHQGCYTIHECHNDLLARIVANTNYFALSFPSGGGNRSEWSTLSPIVLILPSKSDIFMPESASNNSGTCAAIWVRSPVILCMPAESPLPVETTVMWSILANGLASALTTSGNPVMSLSRTAAWLYSW